MQFSLRTLLVMLGIAGVALTVLKYPSAWFGVAAPIVLSLVVGYGVALSFLTDEHQKVFWAGFSACLITYLTSAVLANLYLGHGFPTDGMNDVFGFYLGIPIWMLFHGEVPDSSTNVGGLTGRDFSSFVLSLHVIISLIIASLVGLSAQFIVQRELLGKKVATDRVE